MAESAVGKIKNSNKISTVFLARRTLPPRRGSFRLCWQSAHQSRAKRQLSYRRSNVIRASAEAPASLGKQILQQEATVALLLKISHAPRISETNTGRLSAAQISRRFSLQLVSHRQSGYHQQSSAIEPPVAVTSPVQEIV